MSAAPVDRTFLSFAISRRLCIIVIDICGSGAVVTRFTSLLPTAHRWRAISQATFVRRSSRRLDAGNVFNEETPEPLRVRTDRTLRRRASVRTKFICSMSFFGFGNQTLNRAPSPKIASHVIDKAAAKTPSIIAAVRINTIAIR